MSKKAGVYKATLGNGLFYIGSSVQLKIREYNHIRSLKLGEHTNALMQRNYDTYKTFDFEVILYCSKEDVLFYEQRALDIFFGTPGCANLTPTAFNTLGLKWTEEQKAKHCLVMSSLSDEIKEKMRQAVIESNKRRTGTKNKPHSEETKNKISLARINKRTSHCKNGHEMTDENCLWEKRGPNKLKRLCKICRKEYERNWYLKKKEKING
jgi:hypothetical protein